MGEIKFYKTRDHTKMKLFATFAAAASAQMAGQPVNYGLPAPAAPVGGLGNMMNNPLMLSLLLGDDIPSAKADYDKICTDSSDKTTCDKEVAKIYDSAGKKIAGVSDADVKTAHDAIMKYKKSSSSSSLTDIMMLSMMSGGGMQGGMQSMLPLLLLKDNSGSSSGLFGGDNSLLLMMMMGQNGGMNMMG